MNQAIHPMDFSFFVIFATRRIKFRERAPVTNIAQRLYGDGVLRDQHFVHARTYVTNHNRDSYRHSSTKITTNCLLNGVVFSSEKSKWLIQKTRAQRRSGQCYSIRYYGPEPHWSIWYTLCLIWCLG